MPRSTQEPAPSLSPSNTGLSPSVVELSSSLLLTTHESETPALQPRLNEFSRFGLIPVRSPLLGESRLISLPAGTEMFHFPALARTDLCIQSGVMEHDFHWVAPFRDPRIKGCFAPPRGLSQHTTSFIAFRRQGIHLMLLSTYSRNKLPFHPYSIVNEPFPKRTFRKVPVVTPIRIHESFAPSFSARLAFSILLFWWSWTESNRLPPACKAGALPNELQPLITMVGLERLELSTSRLSGVRSNHLSYRPDSLVRCPGSLQVKSEWEVYFP